jgi:large subunit ribosomal protein L27
MVENQNQNVYVKILVVKLAIAGNIIKTKRFKTQPGANVYISKDHTPHARDGVVKFQRKREIITMYQYPFEVEV